MYCTVPKDFIFVSTGMKLLKRDPDAGERKNPNPAKLCWYNRFRHTLAKHADSVELPEHIDRCRKLLVSKEAEKTYLFAEKVDSFTQMLAQKPT